ncbi:MAG: SAM-dependent methyltransferase [Streptosporangiales bacterium]|nr:SAM-dependent methyltransferase [Streptosporangiales bacterium]
MTEHPGPAHAGFDIEQPNPARMSDYYLGGKDNFAADRAAADAVIRAAPEVRTLAVASRAFLGRAVRFLVDQGIRQFIDIGAGLPTQENVHQVAQRAAPGSRVVYVDHDPIVLLHARALLEENADTAVVEGDVRRPLDILADPRLRKLIDLDRPVAVLMFSVLHYLAHGEKPGEIVATVRDAVVPGSYIGVSHLVTPPGGKAIEDVLGIYKSALNANASAGFRRTQEDVLGFFEGLELVEPGFVDLTKWRPEGTPEASSAQLFMYGGIARRP